MNNRTTETTFDRATWTETTTTAMGRIVTRSLDTLGRPVQLTSPGRDAVVLQYDSRGRVQSVTQGERQILYGYDPQSGFRASSTVADLNETSLFTRDAIGRVTQTTNAGAQSTSMAYDAVGNVISLTPPARASHVFDYTPSDLASSYTAPAAAQGDGVSTSYVEYTKHRLPKLITREDGSSVQFTYRNDGKLATVASPRGTSSISYHATTGRVIGITDVDSGALTFAYDGTLPTTVTWAGSGRPSGTVAMTYDNNLWVDVITVNGVTIADYAYDNDGLVISTGPLTISRSAQTGDITATTLDNIATTQTANSHGEVDDFHASQSGTTLLREQVSARDARGRVTERVETVAGVSKTYEYSYDSAGRLTDVHTDGAQSAHYDYDANGNRTARTTSANAESGSYDGQDRLTSYGAATYTYRATGELSARVDSLGTTSYDYDVFGNLRGVTLPDGRSVVYEIDATNRRIGKRLNGVRQYGLLYQSLLAPIALLDASNNIAATFSYATRPNTPDYMIKSGQRYRLITDALGSVRLVVRTSDGSIAQRLDYDEFGKVLSDTNPGFQPFGFAGGLYDADTGLVRFGARDYDAETGRWTAKDPILFAGGQANLYAYVNSDPINRVDSDGRDLNDWTKFPTEDQHRKRNLYNRCPATDPGRDVCGKDHDLWFDSKHGNKYRGSDGSECKYDELGLLDEEGSTYNYTADYNKSAEDYLMHVWQDVAPEAWYYRPDWCSWCGPNYEPGLTDVY